MAVWTRSELVVPNPVSPALLVSILNDGVLKWHRAAWEREAGHSIEPPHYTVGFCLTKRCPCATFLYGYCMGCTKVRFGVEVKKSTLKTVEQPHNLGLFANKNFSENEYVCVLFYEMKPAEGGTTLLEPADPRRYPGRPTIDACLSTRCGRCE
jgi:hypothetical protein